jgi:antitoxin YefM
MSHDGMMETLHLLRSPANAERLMRSIKAADADRLEQRALPEEPRSAGQPPACLNSVRQQSG